MKTINLCLILILVSNVSWAQKMDYVPFEYNTSKYDNKIHKTLYILTPPLPVSIIITGEGRNKTKIAQYKKSVIDAFVKVLGQNFDSLVFIDNEKAGELVLKIGLLDPYWNSPTSYDRSSGGRQYTEYPYCLSFHYQATLLSADGKEIFRIDENVDGYLTKTKFGNAKEVVKAGFVSLLDAINEKVFMKPGVYDQIK